MIVKLRRKFVAVCMALVAAVLAAVLVALSVSMQRNIATVSHQVLQQVIRQDALDSRSEFGFSIGGDEIRLPYFTVDIWGDTAYVTGGTYKDLENTDALQTILRDCMAQETDAGVLKEYQLRYLRQDNGLFYKLAFVDMSMEQATMHRMMGSYLIVSLAALLLLLGVSVLLSFWVTRPVERAWRQQRQFLSDASHELKTPLTVILSNAELLENSTADERTGRWVDNILSESRRMRTLVEEMLTLARADALAKPAPFSPLSLTDLAMDCALSFEPVAFEAGKTLTYRLAQQVQVLGDADRLSRLVSVLLDNAIKYGAAGAPVELTLERTDRTARLTVANAGEPIPPQQLSHLFERFYRADQSRGEQEGFGLGLSIAAAIAKEHHATLRAESDEVSTRFRFTIPLKK